MVAEEAVLRPHFRTWVLGAQVVALAFGLTLLTMAFTIGPISGCHIKETGRNTAEILTTAKVSAAGLPADGTSFAPQMLMCERTSRDRNKGLAQSKYEQHHRESNDQHGSYGVHVGPEPTLFFRSTEL